MQQLGFTIGNPQEVLDAGRKVAENIDTMKTPIPAGEYVIALHKWESKSQSFARGGSGIMVKMQFKVTEGEHAGRIIFKDVCAKHTGSRKAEEIAQAELVALMNACGSTRTDTLDPCVQVPVRALVDIEGPRKGSNGQEYPARNEIKPLQYFRIEAPAAPYQQQAAQPSYQPAPQPAAPQPAPSYTPAPAPAANVAAAQQAAAAPNKPAWMTGS